MYQISPYIAIIYVDFLNLKNLSKRASLVKAIHRSSKLERSTVVQISFIQFIKCNNYIATAKHNIIAALHIVMVDL